MTNKQLTFTVLLFIICMLLWLKISKIETENKDLSFKIRSLESKVSVLQDTHDELLMSTEKKYDIFRR